jgi:hypothetical protein
MATSSWALLLLSRLLLGGLLFAVSAGAIASGRSPHSISAPAGGWWSGDGTGLQLRPCGEANATGRQNWTVGDGNNNGPIGLAGADLWLALMDPAGAPSPAQPRVVLTRNRSAALNFDFLPAGHGQRGTEAWIRTTGQPSWQPGGLCLDDFSSAPHHPSSLPPGGIFMGGCDEIDGAETWVALGAEHWSTRHKPHWLVCGSTENEECLTAGPVESSRTV